MESDKRTHHRSVNAGDSSMKNFSEDSQGFTGPNTAENVYERARANTCTKQKLEWAPDPKEKRWSVCLCVCSQDLEETLYADAKSAGETRFRARGWGGGVWLGMMARSHICARRQSLSIFESPIFIPRHQHNSLISFQHHGQPTIQAKPSALSKVLKRHTSQLVSFCLEHIVKSSHF